MSPDFSLYDALDVPVFVIGRAGDGRIVYHYCNPASYAMTGKTADSMIGRTATETFGDRLGRTIAARHEEAMRRGGRYGYDVTLPVSQGESVISNTTAPLAGHPGLVVGTTRVMGNRLSHGRSLSREAREIEREVALAQRALGLRGPMRKFGMLVDEVKRDFTDLGNGKLQLIEEIGRLGDEAYDLVRQVLTYTRAVASRPVTPERIDLADFCETLFATFDPDAQHRLVAQRHDIVVEQAVLWFVLHELLTTGLAEPGTHEFSVVCRQDPVGMLRIGVSCSAPVPEDATPEDCEFPEIETVLKSRGGRFIPEFDGGRRSCSFVLPGRVIETTADEASEPGARMNTAPPEGGTVSDD